jgi:hypothetical protein
MNKTDVKVLKRGLKRMGLALLTAALFAISVISLIKVATAPGYLAVLLFIIAILEMVMAITFLYAQGLSPKVSNESQGDCK